MFMYFYYNHIIYLIIIKKKTRKNQKNSQNLFINFFFQKKKKKTIIHKKLSINKQKQTNISFFNIIFIFQHKKQKKLQISHLFLKKKYQQQQKKLLNNNNKKKRQIKTRKKKIKKIKKMQTQQDEQEIKQQQQQQITSKKENLPNYQSPITRTNAQNVIYNFKKHLQENLRKKNTKQHVNKIIHYHLQHTFFLKYAAPLFINIYNKDTQQNYTKSLTLYYQKLKEINMQILGGNEKIKSVQVLDIYLRKLDEYYLLNQFLEVLIYILFGEKPVVIPIELNDQKKNLFFYVSPIIAFLIFFYIHVDNKPSTLDDLVIRSGLKQLYKNTVIEGDNEESENNSEDIMEIQKQQEGEQYVQFQEKNEFEEEMMFQDNSSHYSLFKNQNINSNSGKLLDNSQ
ncbi:hypothetical protein IMG5_041100 [Ichthyophthirius multifiliis]|uniref:Transmembrane protein n=1 Tax=Ichthyophthirius multifiliis TaxID=5932 RepID=G0QM13_ICHMU|nr:hypothetical protein IMG5_041100 [Ichthyophthirius multifiliis]EGR33741.1 hypothetical protein IMG5_041100 [Ichthyophthirius multifiliis]|eukprot:XP_004037727.1 hypothetical protein IMG5_041100 [Ichthyophthirius multifiliis]